MTAPLPFFLGNARGLRVSEVMERGRPKRFHGAFSGGFSAGYFNTVGSKEGWPRERNDTGAPLAPATHDVRDEPRQAWPGPAPQTGIMKDHETKRSARNELFRTEIFSNSACFHSHSG